MKNFLYLVWSIILLSEPTFAKTCVAVRADTSFFMESSKTIPNKDLEVQGIKEAKIAVEFADNGQDKELEAAITSANPSSTACAAKQAGAVTNIRATLTLTRSNGKQDGIQCSTEDLESGSMDREYVTKTFKNPYIEFKLDKVLRDIKPNVRQDLRVERCSYTIKEGKPKKR
jgi:hypothetical protein